MAVILKNDVDHMTVVYIVFKLIYQKQMITVFI